VNQRRIIGGAVVFAALVVTGIACRQGEPNGDPKIPTNSPIPEVDRTERDPKASPTPKIGDAG
jgi:hypothetical protein